MNLEEETLVKRIVHDIYKTYCPKQEHGYLNREDLFHFGIIGLLNAKKHYKPEKNVPFNAYAAIRIRGEVMDALRKSPMIRLPQEKRSKVKQLEQVKKTLLNNGIEPDIDAVSNALGWTVNQVLETENLSRIVVSVDGGTPSGKVIPLLSGESVENHVLNKDLAILIHYCLEQIKEDIDRLVFIAREKNGMTLKQLADRFDYSIETIRQKNIAAKQSMKLCLKYNGWDVTDH
ncbi:MAG: sigma-70 family RNA polymerase sigma factor [Desulfobacteraceae bacterium]|nr:sigma-70 family RNA polymerase sigma factor [Desulfobacteraceae bacterium]